MRPIFVQRSLRHRGQLVPSLRQRRRWLHERTGMGKSLVPLWLGRWVLDLKSRITLRTDTDRVTNRVWIDCCEIWNTYLVNMTQFFLRLPLTFIFFRSPRESVSSSSFSFSFPSSSFVVVFDLTLMWVCQLDSSEKGPRSRSPVLGTVFDLTLFCAWEERSTPTD